MIDLNNQIIPTIIFLYVSYGLLIMYTGRQIHKRYIILLYFIMFKMIFYYEKCTLSYLECLFRSVKKEDGYLFQFLNGFIQVRYKKVLFCYLIFFTVIISFKFFNEGGSLI